MSNKRLKNNSNKGEDEGEDTQIEQNAAAHEITEAQAQSLSLHAEADLLAKSGMYEEAIHVRNFYL